MGESMSVYANDGNELNGKNIYVCLRFLVEEATGQMRWNIGVLKRTVIFLLWILRGETNIGR